MPILIVEDDLSLAKGVRKVLEQRGLTTVVVHDSNQAIAELRARTFSIVLLDLMLPSGDGSQVISYIRNEHPAPRPVVIVMTAADAKVLAKIDRTIARTVLFKPLDLSQLAEYVSVTRTQVSPR